MTSLSPDRTKDAMSASPTSEDRAVVSLLNASEDELKKISAEGLLSLSVDEMKTIQTYFAKLGRNPTDVELESLAQTWSEHCVHKTFKAHVTYTETTGAD